MGTFVLLPQDLLPGGDLGERRLPAAVQPPRLVRSGCADAGVHLFAAGGAVFLAGGERGQIPGALRPEPFQARAIPS
ncbi:hypothetical protein [Streptomyces uncialis]|uniref:hypothetical protein n=1 Tax=Streptomyces uncialis TaxID=1048205 RepID=UPI0037B63471